MKNVRIGRFPDEKDPEGFHWIESETIPFIVLDSHTVLMMNSIGFEESLQDPDFEKTLTEYSYTIQFYLNYDEEFNKVIMRGEMRTEEKLYRSKQFTIDAEDFAQAVYNSTVGSSPSTNPYGMLEEEKEVRELMDSCINDILQEVLKDTGIITERLAMQGKGFIMSKGLKIGTFEGIKFHSRGTNLSARFNMMDVNSPVDLYVADELSLSFENGLRVLIDLDFKLPEEGRFSAHADHITVSAQDFKYKATNLQGRTKYHSFVPISDPGEKYQDRITLLDDISSQEEDPFDRFSDLF